MQAAAGVVAGSALVVAAARAVYMLTADQEAGADAQLDRDGGRDDEDDDDLEAQHLPSSPPVASPEVESYAPYDPPPALEFPDPPSKIVPKT